MAIPVLAIGESGSGKSSAMRNFEPEEIGVFEVASKPLPFRKQLPVIKPATYDVIYRSWERAKQKDAVRPVYVIDDSQYLMTFEAFGRAKETGYGKFTDFALNFYNLIQYVINSLPDDTIVYFLHHLERTDTGIIKAKTLGKMLDSQLTLEGLFSIVLYCQTDGTDHWFTTQSDGYTTAKSPMEMFPARIDNDLKAVDTAIREYYNITTEEKSNAEKN
jgi:hypothetical protein